jgi:hypothetical protein
VATACGIMKLAPWAQFKEPVAMEAASQ